MELADLLTQVIANTTRFGGIAWTAHSLTNLVVGISVTTVHTNNGGWARTFVHEFGHSFGSLADERDGVNGRNAPNMTNDRDNPRWSHWIGHGGIGQPAAINSTNAGNWFVSRGVTRNWLGIIQSGCIMAYSHSNLGSFCRVCSAELTRRLAHMNNRETFVSRHPNPAGGTPINATTVTMPNNATRVLPYAFNGNTTVQTIRMGDQISLIADYAFLGAANLRTIIIDTAMPPTVRANTFSGAPSNITFFVPVGSGNIYRNASGWAGRNIVEMYNTHLQSDGTLRLDRVNYPMGSAYEIPERIRTVENFWQDGNASGHQRINRWVTAIGAGAFQNNTSLSQISIPTSVTHIGNGAFTNASSLHTLTLPFVGENADGTGRVFLSHLFGADLQSRPEVVPASLRNVTVTGGTIQNTSFGGLTNITNITIHSAVSSIHNNSFFGTTSLERITITGTNSNYFSGSGILYRRGSYIEIVHAPHRIQGDISLPHGVASVPANTFQNRRYISSVIIPNSVTHIGRGAFSGAVRLEEITLPFIGERADGTGATSFTHIFGFLVSDPDFVPLTRVTITNTTRIPNYAFQNLYNIESITLPDNLQEIGEGAFENLFVLSEIIIPYGVTRIERNAFNATALTNITIPASVTYIGSRALKIS